MTDSFDSEDGLGSPRLEAQRVDYQLKPDVPPFLANEYVSSEKSPEDKESRPRESLPNPKPETGAGNSVLINSLEPNRPDIANHEREFPLFSSVPDDELGPPKIPVKPKSERPQQAPPATQPSQQALAANALQLLIDPNPEGDEKPLNHEEPKPEHNSPNLSQNHQQVLPPINFSTGPERQELPPIQPPPQIKSASSPGHNSNQILPSISCALGDFSGTAPKDPSGRVNGTTYSFQPVPGSSPPFARNELARDRPGQYQMPLSPYSHLSPASSKDMSSPISQPPYVRKSDISFVTTSYDASTQAAKSPATSYPTPTDHPSVSSSDRTPYNSNAPPPNGTIPTGSYKCRHPGCTALPFQTQYLLNSHANVHSQDRPHYCPVEGCPRGLGGKGFKRKNEMIRHGLVHNSPGYVCPFCPEQQHKYPRPDNLQRHVRVHHVDRNRDDPELRQVLSQRPEGSTRGRRRRTNA